MPLTKLNSASVIERLPTGSVIQTKISTKVTSLNNQSADFDTGLNVDIAPTSTSNRLFITLSASMYVFGTAQWWNKIYVDGSFVDDLEQQMYLTSAVRRITTSNFIYTPTSTNSINIKWRMVRASGTMNWGEANQSMFMVQEIKQ
jgi:hypothetical protein